ncbi:MAG TPA: hypothetical protein VK671_17000 [Mucilaginibacter sp.]|nr:hypothetical protein [Mucilaginibacter sp.]
MDCLQLYGAYQNQIIEIDFKQDSEAFKDFGGKLIGLLFYPMPTGGPFYVDEKISEHEVQQHKLVRLCFKITPGFKFRFGVSDETEKLLMDKGFSCKDVKQISRPNEIHLEVSGNINPSDSEPKFLSFTVSGIWGFNQQGSMVSLTKSGFTPVALNGTQFYELCNNLRSCHYEDIDNVLKKRNIDFKLEKATNEELDLIKAIVNIFIWLEYYLVEGDISPDTKNLMNNNEFLPKMYNDFVTDGAIYNDKLKDIYFLDQKHQFGDNAHEQLDKLVKLKLLSKTTLTVRNEKYKNYFMPFSKPKDYKVIIGKDLQLLSIYNQILVDRNIALNNFYNKR